LHNLTNQRIVALGTAVCSIPTALLYRRFRQISDNMVDAFIHPVDQYGNQSETGLRGGRYEGHNRGDHQPEDGRSSTESVYGPVDTGNTPFSKVKAEGVLFARTERFAPVSDQAPS
jgi:hypothetical protein